jgi:cell division transport system ATP-binding protein
MVRFQDVEVCYVGRRPILTSINFKIKPHSFHFLTGKSGAGKSSLLKMMYLALAPSKGRIELFGRDTAMLKSSHVSAVRKRIGIVFQDFRLIQNLNICDNVALPLRIFGAKEAIIRRYVPELLDWVGLGDHLSSFPSSLSGGEQQRVAIARAVIARPNLLLADEPTGNVDDKIAERLMYLFEELYKAGTSIVIATHNENLVNNFNYPSLNIEKGNLVLKQ